MATRSHISTPDNQTLVYKHYDGYPQGVIPTLYEVSNEFAKHRGNDPEYFIAFLIKQFAFAEADDWMSGDKPNPNMVPQKITNLKEDYHKSRQCTGWGVGSDFHGDIEYYYEVDLKAKEIKIFKRSWNRRIMELKVEAFSRAGSNFYLDETIKLGEGHRYGE